ncbi:MAG: phosphate signaling complex protein PhoU [Oscillospiraceae bacterium]|nr:phosphate signaling complex protein PhoU [Oscillospiraceae bacterium]
MNARQRFDEELQALSDSLIKMGETARTAIDRATTALLTGDRTLAQQVVDDDDQMDEMERNIEQTCLRLLLKQQPVARDLRKISTAIKMITDIERIGDAAADIAEISLHLTAPMFPEIQADLKAMAAATQDMASSAIAAYVKEDLELAKQTQEKDDIVDDYFLTIRAVLGEKIRTDVSLMDAALDYLMIIKYLERVGDHAENICEWVEFYKTGIRKNDRIF